MVVESGHTVVLSDLDNAGILNHTGGDILINGNFTNTATGIFAQMLGDLEIKGDILDLFPNKKWLKIFAASGNKAACFAWLSHYSRIL